MKRIVLSGCVVWLGMAFSLAQASAPVKAQTPASAAPEALTLSRAVSIFLDNNLLLMAARFDVDTAEAEEITARLRPNPGFSLDLEGLPSNFEGRFFQSQEITPYVDYTLELGGKRQKRIDSARANTTVAEAEFRTAMWHLSNEFKRQFFAVVLAKSRLDLALANQETFANILQDNRQLYEAGEISGLDIRRLEVEKIRFDVDVANARSDYQLSLRDWRLSLGGDYQNNDYTVSGELEYQPLQFDRSDLEQQALRLRPDLETAKAGEVAADADIRLQRSYRIPDLTLGFNYKRDGSDNVWAYGGEISIPLFDRNQGERAKALIEKNRALNARRILTNNVVHDVDRALSGFEIQKQRVEAYRSGILTRIDEIQTLTEESYKAGEASVLDLLDAVRTRRETQSSYYDTLFDYVGSLLDLELATATTIVR